MHLQNLNFPQIDVGKKGELFGRDRVWFRMYDTMQRTWAAAPQNTLTVSRNGKWPVFIHPQYLWATWPLSNIDWVTYYTSAPPPVRTNLRTSSRVPRRGILQQGNLIRGRAINPHVGKTWLLPFQEEPITGDSSLWPSSEPQTHTRIVMWDHSPDPWTPTEDLRARGLMLAQPINPPHIVLI